LNDSFQEWFGSYEFFQKHVTQKATQKQWNTELTCLPNANKKTYSEVLYQNNHKYWKHCHHMCAILAVKGIDQWEKRWVESSSIR
jgi:hypothetical protein